MYTCKVTAQIWCPVFLQLPVYPSDDWLYEFPLHPGPSKDFTIVTSLIDLNRERWNHFHRPFEQYLFYAVQVLNMNAPMVIFADPKTRDFVEYHRQGKDHVTEIIDMPISDLEYYRHYSRIVEIMSSENFRSGHPYLLHPEGFSPEYNILMNSKFSFLRQASLRNYFRTGYFYWMDIGYGHGEDIFPKSCLWSPRSIMNRRNQITYIQLNPLSVLDSIEDLYKKDLPPFFNGAFFGGSRSAVMSYYFLHKALFLEFLADGKVDDDQTMAVACYFNRSSLFHLVRGWWYDVFTLLG